jgi:hypothetical protein
MGQGHGNCLKSSPYLKDVLPRLDDRCLNSLCSFAIDVWGRLKTVAMTLAHLGSTILDGELIRHFLSIIPVSQYSNLMTRYMGLPEDQLQIPAFEQELRVHYFVAQACKPQGPTVSSVTPGGDKGKGEREGQETRQASALGSRARFPETRK